MATSFLYRRMVVSVPGNTGTLSEPRGTPEPRFALQSTVNWMRALAIVAQHEGIDWSSMQHLYVDVHRANLPEPAVNTVFEQLLMSLHHLAALQAMANAGSACDLARIAVVTWYYGIYCAASAMIAARDGSLQDDHAGTANQWDRQIAAHGLMPRPFKFRLTTLIKRAADAEITVMRNGSNFDVNNCPTNVDDAIGACASYLSGTRAHREGQINEDMKGGELKKLGLSDFRTKPARQLRDDRLAGKTLGFVHQAFRYRGKANYRDALFLTYEAQVGTVLDGFMGDLDAVLKAFLTAAGAFCSRRVSKADWLAYINDLEGHLKFAVMPKDIWA